MSRIDDLIAEHCPNGVERRALGAVGEFIRGSGLQKKDLRAEGVPAVHYGQIHTRYGIWTEEAVSFVDHAFAAKLRHARPGDLLIATTSEDDEAVGKATAWLGTEDVVLSGDAYIYRHSLDSKYVAYFFSSEQFQMQKMRFISGAKVRRLSGESLGKIRIPVPPLAVQHEIVRILDTFTELEAELKAELGARRAQLAYYRDAKIDGQRSEAQSVALGDIAEFKYGFTDKAADNGTHRFLRITDINSQGKLSASGAKFVSPDNSASDYLVRPGDLLMARTGATYGKTMVVQSSEPAVYASFLIRIRFKESQMLPAFYWYFAQSAAYWDQAHALVSTAGQPQFNANALKRVRVPIPVLEEQASVVHTLDRFDALVNDISFGLPAEIEARRKQYEYYRDRLLSFKELTA